MRLLFVIDIFKILLKLGVLLGQYKCLRYQGKSYLFTQSRYKKRNIKGQALRVLEMAEQRFEEAGTNKDNILRAEIFVKDIYRDFAGFNEIWDGWVSKENPPARACVEANMASVPTLVEIIFTAVKVD